MVKSRCFSAPVVFFCALGTLFLGEMTAFADLPDNPVESSSNTISGSSLTLNGAELSRRAKPMPYDSIFPQTEYLGPTIGVSSSAPVSPLNDFLWNHSHWLKDHQITISGWVDAGYNASSSQQSNEPMTYDIVSSVNAQK